MNTYYQYYSRTLLPVLLIIFSIGITSCDDGDTGPQGPQGEQGEKGDTGDVGTEGKSILTKSGYFQGTVTGTRQDDTPFTETFKYEYRYDAYEAVDTDDGNELRLLRMENGNDYNEGSPYLNMSLNILNPGTANESASIRQFYFALQRTAQTSKQFRLSAGFDYGDDSDIASTIVLTNYVHNLTTGVVSFDFAYTDDYDGGENQYNSTRNPLTITGSFNSGTGKVYTNVVGRKGN